MKSFGKFLDDSVKEYVTADDEDYIMVDTEDGTDTGVEIKAKNEISDKYRDKSLRDMV